MGMQSQRKMFSNFILNIVRSGCSPMTVPGVNWPAVMQWRNGRIFVLKFKFVQALPNKMRSFTIAWRGIQILP